MAPSTRQKVTMTNHDIETTFGDRFLCVANAVFTSFCGSSGRAHVYFLSSIHQLSRASEKHWMGPTKSLQGTYIFRTMCPMGMWTKCLMPWAMWIRRPPRGTTKSIEPLILCPNCNGTTHGDSPVLLCWWGSWSQEVSNVMLMCLVLSHFQKY